MSQMMRMMRRIDPRAIRIGTQGMWIALVEVWSVEVVFFGVVVLRLFVVLDLLEVVLFGIV
jgi:hypothetical protein